MHLLITFFWAATYVQRPVAVYLYKMLNCVLRQRRHSRARICWSTGGESAFGGPRTTDGGSVVVAFFSAKPKIELLLTAAMLGAGYLAQAPREAV